jgi:hypothetical protein
MYLWLLSRALEGWFGREVVSRLKDDEMSTQSDCFIIYPWKGKGLGGGFPLVHRIVFA